METSRPRWRRLLLPGAFFLFLAAEFILFDQVGAHHHTGIYPRWHDQIQYLMESYTGYIYSQAQGWREGLWHALINPSAQGTLHDFFAIAIFDLAGPSRSAALSVNMLAFLAWQTAVFIHLLRRTHSPACTWIGVSMVLAARSAWLPGPGSAFDFRLDWLATCMMGLSVVSCLETRSFRSTTGSALFGFCVGLTMLTRFLTGAYMAGAFIIFGLWVLFGPERMRRSANLLLSGLIAAGVAGPLMWLNREWIYNYYLVGHFSGPESAIRSPHWGFFTSVKWFGSTFLTEYIGIFALFLFFAGLLVLVPAILVAAKAPAERGFRIVAPKFSLVPLLTFFVVPATILILHTQKSPYVLGVALPGLLMLLLEPLMRLGQATSNRWVNGVAIAMVSATLIGFIVRIAPNPHPLDFLATAQRVNDFADMMARRCKLADLEEPRVAVDRVTDCLDGQVLRVLCYERHKIWIPFEMMLPMGIIEQPEADIWDHLSQSDFIVLMEEGPPGPWPADAQMDRLRPQVLAWAKAKLTPIKQLDVLGMRFQVYAQQATPLPGDPVRK